VHELVNGAFNNLSARLRCVFAARRVFTSCCVTRTFPSRSYFNVAKHFSCGIAHVSEGVAMRAQRIFVSFAIAMGCGITIQSTAFSLEIRGTWEQQMACTPRRLAALRRGSLAAKYSATQRTVPRGF
jgi:hypothetical protein